MLPEPYARQRSTVGPPSSRSHLQEFFAHCSQRLGIAIVRDADWPATGQRHRTWSRSFEIDPQRREFDAQRIFRPGQSTNMLR